MASSEEKAAQSAITPIGIACFVHVWEPFAFKAKPGDNQKDPNFSMILLFKDDEDYEELKAIVKVAAMKKFGAEEIKRLSKKGKFNLPFRDASDYEEYGEPFTMDGYSGGKFITASSRTAPGVVDERAKPIMNQMDFYAGCMARMSVYAHPYDSMGNQGVTFLLNNVQKAGDGKRIDGRKAATEEFEPVKGAKPAKGGGDDLDDLF